MAFGSCAACHPDGHLGQLAAARHAPAPDCRACHNEEAFLPARFDAPDHDKTHFPLQAAHRAVSCAMCHPQEPKLALRIPGTQARALARQGRRPAFSLALFEFPKGSSRCEACHADTHAGQFAQRIAKDGCVACHDAATSFTPASRFDHARDSRFALTGAHARARCEACHPAETTGRQKTTRYRPLPAECGDCHADAHAGQFDTPAASGPRASSCARCHGTEDFKKSTFRHEAPFTDFALEGLHAPVKCERCHVDIDAGGGAKVRRYKQTPRECEACHADPHGGAFVGFQP
jgi:hypothetical protein